MKVAVIGCGKIATNQHIPAYMKNPKTEIKYFCDIIPERAKKAVADNGCGIAVTDYRQVLADPEVEAISVCTPNYKHAEITVAALEAGKHVLCEKPASDRFEDALKMQETQHRTGKTLNIGVCNRYNAGVNKVKELIDKGELGEVYAVYVSFRNQRSIPGLGGDFTTKAISGGGVLIDWGVHFLDIVMYCCGDPEAKTVSAETFCRLGKPIEDYTFVKMWAGPPKKDGVCDVEEGVMGIVRTAGPTITINGAWAQNIGENEMFIDFMGTRGGVRLQYGKDFTYYGTLNGMLTKTTFNLPTPSMYEEEIAGFVDCIETGKRSGAHIDTNIITAKMMDAIYRSAETHKEVVLSEEVR